MNRKGFTLIELLAVIALTAIVGGIATYSIISTINNSKLKSEKVFVDKLANLIDDYLDIRPISNQTGSTYTFKKCRDTACNDTYEVTATKVVKADGSLIYLKDLVTANIVEEADLVNPKNKEQCLSETNPEIIIYKDSDYVYHYYVDLTENDCDISQENSLIDNIPENLVKTLNDNSVILPDKLKEKYNLQ